MNSQEQKTQHKGYRQYEAYLLRLWQETADTPWRYLLESVQTGQRRGFSTLEGLFVYLDQISRQSEFSTMAPDNQEDSYNTRR